MKTRQISRRRFLQHSTLAAAGALAGSFSMTGCNSNRQAAAKISRYNPKTDGGCAVAFGYDMDMPCGGNAYLYDRSLGWLYNDDCAAHGHLNQDVRDYVRHLTHIAEDYDLGLEFFVQGNTFEKEIDAALWKEIAQRGHAIDSHMYYHDSLIGNPVEEVRSQLTKTKRLIESHCGTKNIGLRGPGGYRNALNGREDVQQVILDVGIKWASTQFKRPEQRDDASWIALLPEVKPFYYPTGLIEIPFAGHQDRSYFDVDMGGSPRPVDDWINYLKGCVDLAHEQNLLLALTTHPSTSFKHDPQARYLSEIFAYCRQKQDIVICNYQDMYRWIAADPTRI